MTQSVCPKPTAWESNFWNYLLFEIKDKITNCGKPHNNLILFLDKPIIKHTPILIFTPLYYFFKTDICISKFNNSDDEINLLTLNLFFIFL